MPEPRRKKSPGATTLDKPAETMSSGAVTVPQSSTPSQPVAAAAAVSPSESEIAAVAHQIWLDKGCPAGSDQEDWFQAEAMLKAAYVTNCEDLSRRPAMSSSEPRTEFQMVVEFRWGGHWEVWESEWGDAHWIWD